MADAPASRDTLPLSPTSPFATRTGAEVPPSSYHGPRREIDAAFLRSLINYASRDPECPPLFKAFIEDVILKQGAGDMRSRAAAYLSNPQLREYMTGPNFTRLIEEYKLYNKLYPTEVTELMPTTSPSAPIPVQYLPSSQHSAGSSTDLGSVFDPDYVESEPDEDYADELDEVEDEGPDQIPSPHVEQPVRRNQPPQAPSIPAALRDYRPVAAPSARSRGAPGTRAGQFIGKHGALFQRLQAIRPRPTTEIFVDGDEAMGRTGPDWEVDSWYKDIRQPPLAARLDTVIKFLAEEDVDRCLDWDSKFEEVVSYLEWLANQDDSHQLDHASQQTQAMFNDALNKAKAHVLFNEHHYNPTPLEITRPRKRPLRSTRLSWMVDGQNWPLPARTTVPDRTNLLPKSITPRPPGPVNKMLVDRPEEEHHHEQFVQDEKAFWTHAAEGAPERDNLAVIEDKAFHSFSRGNKTGWIRTDPATGRLSLPNGRPLRSDNPKSWATERGARRAGLQQILRALPTVPTTPDLNTPWRRLVLPTPAATLRKACESAAGPHWTPPSLDRTQLTEEQQQQLDPMACTVEYRERLRQIKMARELALIEVEDEHRGDARWAALPRNLVNGGPVVGPVLDAEGQARRELVRQCRAAVGMLDAAYRRVPRPLLNEVLYMVGAGEKGVAREPEGVRLAADEWERVGHERLPRLVDEDEVQWLKFLAGECVNGKNWTGRFVPDTPRDKYRLFLLFATKVQKLLDDPNPDGLFGRHDAEVTVEDLLAAINAGMDSSAVTKYEFQPHDACCWLDRLHESGHVRFHLDPTCYGVVQRPVAEYFPEDRVLWPAKRGRRERPKNFPEHTTDWSGVIHGRKPNVIEGSPIWNFFLSLAFRLGHTITALEQDQAQQPALSHSAAARNLRDAIAQWKFACARLPDDASQEGSSLSAAEEVAPTRQELAVIRTKMIDELSTNAPMLFPSRKHRTAFVRDHNWDWASLRVRNQPKRRQYWSVNRWPLGTGHLSERAERAVKEDENLDSAVTYDPATMDLTTDRKYLRPKLRPYRQEKTVYRPGPAFYALGDTRLQRERLEQRTVKMVERALGLDVQRQRTWSDALASLNPFSRPSSRAEGRTEGGKLPPVDPKAIPKSWAPEEEAEQQVADEMEPGYEWEEIVDDIEVGSVDVPMTGMGESWLTA